MASTGVSAALASAGAWFGWPGGGAKLRDGEAGLAAVGRLRFRFGKALLPSLAAGIAGAGVAGAAETGVAAFGGAALGGAGAVWAGMTVVLLEMGSLPRAGTSTTSVHFGQRAFLPAYLASTLNFVAQDVQRQSTSAMINPSKDREAICLWPLTRNEGQDTDELRYYQPSPRGPQDLSPASGKCARKNGNFLVARAILECEDLVTLHYHLIHVE
jgi:hypothetical protein